MLPRPDATTTQRSFDPVPAAWYTVAITESEYKQNSAASKDPTGFYYKFKNVIMDGPYKGRVVYAQYNVVNANKDTETYAIQDMQQLYLGIGCQSEDLKSPTQMHNRPYEAKLIIVPATAKYEAKNDIKGYRAVGSGSVVAGGAPPIPGAPPAAPAAPPAAPAAPLVVDGAATVAPWEVVEEA